MTSPTIVNLSETHQWRKESTRRWALYFNGEHLRDGSRFECELIEACLLSAADLAADERAELKDLRFRMEGLQK